ncbi:MAG: group III truncated hemoglobin [Asticcacaulis sp.]
MTEHAREARQRIREQAAAIGIDEVFISDLVDEFYNRVRRHGVLGPIFNARIHDWDEHLSLLKSFWASVALNAGVYSGKPVMAHRAMSEIEPWHFGVWLGLFDQTLNDIAPTPEAAKYFMERAQRIGESLKLAMFFDPSKL